MPIDKHGSKPEVMPFGSNEWVGQNYTAKEWQPEANGGRGGPKVKTALRDDGAALRAYREGWERVFGKKD